MKKLLLIIAMITLSMSAFAKQESEDNTLFGSQKVTVGGFGGPEIKFSQVNNEAAILVGGRGGLIFNSVANIGIGGYGLVTSHQTNYKINSIYTNDTLAYLRMGYGGLIFGYTNSSKDLIHFTLNVLVGAGGAMYTDSWKSMMNDGNNDYNNHTTTYASSAFFVAEPFVGAELNVTSFFRIEANASYRFVSMLDLPKTTNSDISGLSGGLIFKFGKF